MRDSEPAPGEIAGAEHVGKLRTTSAHRGPELYLSEIPSPVSGCTLSLSYRPRIMNTDAFLLLRFFFILCFLATCFAAYKVITNWEKLFGKDIDAPSETGSSRMYGKMQAVVVLAHAILLFGACILMF